jgi:hypothetical protein
VDVQLLAGLPDHRLAPRRLSAGCGGIRNSGNHRVPQRDPDQGHLQGANTHRQVLVLRVRRRVRDARRLRGPHDSPWKSGKHFIKLLRILVKDVTIKVRFLILKTQCHK